MNRISSSRSVSAETHKSKESGVQTLRELILSLISSYEEAHQACAKSFAPKRVHDLRVASRRLSVALKELKPLRLGLASRSARRAVRKTMKRLGILRDAHVHSKIMRDFAGLLHEKLKMHEKLKKIEARHKKDAVRHFSKSQKKLTKRLTKLKTRLVENESKLAPYTVVAAATIKRELNAKVTELAANASNLEIDRPRSVHQFRLEVKRFRYRREMLAQLVPSALESLAEPLKDLQRLTGAVHDYDELIKRIDKRKQRVNCAALFDELTAKRADAARELRLKIFYFTQQAVGEVLH